MRHLYNYRKTYGKAGPLREAPYEEGRSLREGPVLRGALTGRPPYGKAPYGEASYEKAPYELQESLREATGRDFTRIGREFPLVCRRLPRAGPFLDLLPFKGPFSLTGALTGPPYGKAPYDGKAGPLQEAPYEGAGPYRGPYGQSAVREGPLRGGFLREGPLRITGKLRETLPELGGNFRLCAVDQKRPFFPRAGPFLDLFSLTGALTGPPYGKAPYGEAFYGKAGPLQEAPYEEGRSLREGPGSHTGPSQRRTTKRLTGRPLTGRFVTRRPFTNYRKASRKLRGGTLPELGGDFRLRAVDQKKPFFPRAGPFLDLKGPFSLTGALTGPPYGKAPYGEASYGKAGPLQEAPYDGAGPYRGPYGQTALREGPLRGGFLQEGPLRITGKLTGYGEGLYQNWAGNSACVP